MIPNAPVRAHTYSYDVFVQFNELSINTFVQPT